MTETGDVDTDEGAAATPGGAEEEEAPPADESYLLGRAGAEEQLMAEVARAEAELNDPAVQPATDEENEGAVV